MRTTKQSFTTYGPPPPHAIGPPTNSSIHRSSHSLISVLKIWGPGSRVGGLTQRRRFFKFSKSTTGFSIFPCGIFDFHCIDIKWKGSSSFGVSSKRHGQSGMPKIAWTSKLWWTELSHSSLNHTHSKTGWELIFVRWQMGRQAYKTNVKRAIPMQCNLEAETEI